MKVTVITGGKLNWSKQVTVKGYDKSMTEEQRLKLVEAMERTYVQAYTNPEGKKK